MDGLSDFNLQDRINNWVIRLKSEPSITEKDTEELKSHLLDLITNLKDAGLDDEEAFWVASKRLGKISDWENEYRKSNNWVISLRRFAVILAGVLLYFLFYHFIGFLSKFLLIILLYFKVEGYYAVFLFSRFVIAIHILLVIFFLHLYFRDKKIISFIENMQMKPREVLVLLIFAIFFGIINHTLPVVYKYMIRENYSLRSYLSHYLIWYEYTFPLLICLGFIFIYSKYYKISKF